MPPTMMTSTSAGGDISQRIAGGAGIRVVTGKKNVSWRINVGIHKIYRRLERHGGGVTPRKSRVSREGSQSGEKRIGLPSSERTRFVFS
jgi:hypothetical protein